MNAAGSTQHTSRRSDGRNAPGPERGSAFTPAVSLALLGVLALWIAAVAWIGTAGDFPLSDDWAHAHVVRSLCAGGGFDLLPWTGASLVAQALYGSVACKLAGFSHETLRLTTINVSLLGIVSFHALLRELGASTRVAAAGAASLAFSPLWFNLSFTFMTDVPFAAFAIMSAWLYARALRRGSRRELLLAGLVAALAFLIRQHAVWIAAAAALAALVPPRQCSGDRKPGLETARASDRTDADAGWSSRVAAFALDAGWPSRVIDAAAASVLPLLAAAAYTLWVATSADVPLAVQNKMDEAAGVSMFKVANAAFRALATLGFLLLPWALAIRLDAGRQRYAFAACLAALSAVAVFLFAREGASMFYLTNVLGFSTIGPIATRDVQFLALEPFATGGAACRFVLTAVSLASAAALVTAILVRVPEAWRARSRTTMFCAAALVLSGLGSLAQSHYYFDRYLMAIAPLAVATLVALASPLRAGAAFAVALLLLGAYGVAGTHDYMEWNRARWSLLTDLEARGVSARSIDGGFEYNGERLAAVLGSSPSDAQARRGQSPSVRSWWWVVDDEWVISFSPLEGYGEADARVYPRWLPPGEGRILALHRER